MSPRHLVACLLAGALAIACGGQTAGDAGTTDAATEGATGDGGACQYGLWPEVAMHRSCSQSSECAPSPPVPTSCCDEIVYGIQGPWVRPMAGEITARTADCPRCRCVTQTVDEFGKAATWPDFVATCEGGKCVARAK